MSNVILDAFLALIEEKSEAIEDCNDLYLQIVNWSENVEELSDSVVDYCKTHPLFDASLRSLVIPGDGDRLPGRGPVISAPPIRAEDYKYTILNTMHLVLGTPAPDKKPQS